VRSLLTARKLIQGKLLDIESGIRGVLRGFGLKVGPISRGRFEARILDLVAGQAVLETVVGSMLAARSALQSEFAKLHRALLVLVRADPVCRQLMSVPGVGAVVAITFRSGVDNPGRFRRSRDVGPHFGLTPRKYQSGEIDVTGSISKVGDRMVRTALYEAASVMLSRTVRMSPLKSWAMAVAKGGARRKREWRWHASSASSSTACGSMAPASAGPARSQPRREKESLKRSGQPGRPARSPTAGTVKWVKP